MTNKKSFLRAQVQLWEQIPKEPKTTPPHPFHQPSRQSTALHQRLQRQLLVTPHVSALHRKASFGLL